MNDGLIKCAAIFVEVPFQSLLNLILGVAGSILDAVIGIFHRKNPSGRTMALGLTQLLIEMSTRNISWGVKPAGA